MGRMILYARVSTKKQEVARQLQDIKKKYKFDRVYTDKATGKNADRPQLKTMLEDVKQGDTVIVSELSRLGRNLKDCLTIIDELTAKGVIFRADKESIDTTNPIVANLLISIFGAVGQMERENIVERINQSAEHYKENGTTAKGKKWGRREVTWEDVKHKVPRFEKIYKEVANGTRNLSSMARELEENRTTLRNYILIYEKEFNLPTVLKTKSRAVATAKAKDPVQGGTPTPVKEVAPVEEVATKYRPKRSKQYYKNRVMKKIASKLNAHFEDITIVSEEDTNSSYNLTFTFNDSKYTCEYLKNIDCVELAELKSFLD